MAAGSRDRAPPPWLVGDVGGTHARFGWVAAPGAPITDIRSTRCDEHANLAAAIEHDLAGRAPERPRSASIGVATPVTGDVIAMTNRDWRFSITALQRRLGLDRLLVLNDFAALAHGLDGLDDTASRQVGGGTAVAGAPRALLGPGTGLGVSGLLAAGTTRAPIVGEGGHVSLAAADDAEACVVAILRRRFGHASAERALSGAGLVNLYAASCELAGRPAEPIDAVQVSARALAGSDPRCGEAVGWFFGFLGSVAGDLALTLGARGGVFIAGGIVGRLGEAIDRSPFRARFEAKGRYRDYLAAIPTRVLRDAGAIALRGAAAALDAD